MSIPFLGGVGLIPAHAGKTRYQINERTPRGAHPRACGENSRAVASASRAPGSSPRMRGKQLLSCSMSVNTGLIPAHAGKTAFFLGEFNGCWAHPRACGENFVEVGKDWADVGSSPRMRGKHRGLVADRLTGRLIPAHAGKTTRRGPRINKHRAHPRACGENLPCVSVFLCGGGSSPRMRGKPLIPLSPLSHTGLIPAHAGKTHASCR